PYLFGNKKGKSLEIPLPEPVPWDALNFEEILMFHALKHSLNEFFEALDLSNLTKYEIYHLFSFLEFLNEENSLEVQTFFKDEFNFFEEALRSLPLNKWELQELLHFKTSKLALFAILKRDRSVPGVLLVRSPEGSFVTKDNGDIWSIPILGLSGRGLSFNHSNGCTPMGVYTIDSVMPEANKRFEFGEYRRLIINFIKGPEAEMELQKFLPFIHRSHHWWKQALVAKDLGRSLLRIHGTGRVNRNLFTPYFPFVPTCGCLATNEAGLFGLKKARDQRLLLDALMKAQGLSVCYENELNIHGLLYVVEFDDNLSALRF
ncbi:MAG: hypothetical protein ACXVCE_16280, partial [Bacteriovorax sp.]